jgi:multiple sugar transport system permease protein
MAAADRLDGTAARDAGLAAAEKAALDAPATVARGLKRRRDRPLNEMAAGWKGLAVAGLLLWLLFTAFPIYWTLVTAFKTPPAVNGGPTYVPWLDFQPSLQAWQDILAGIRGQFWHTTKNSTFVSFTAASIALVIGSMAAYALARFPYRVALLAGLIFFVIALGGYIVLFNYAGLSRASAIFSAGAVALVVAILANRLRLPGPVLGNNDIVFWFVSQRMFPPVVVAFALYLMYTEVGKAGFPLIDTFWGLTFCYVAFSLPIVIWLMRDFFEALPVEVEEAALVDDVPQWRIFVEIVLPMSVPGLAATFMITLAFLWNEFLFALFLTNSDWQTLPILVAGQNSQRGDEWWAVSAAALISILPMIVMAVILSRLMRSGLLSGASK